MASARHGGCPPCFCVGVAVPSSTAPPTLSILSCPPLPSTDPQKYSPKKKKKLPDSSQDDIGYADDAAAEAANPLASEDEDDEDEDGFDDPDESGYATATASLGDAASTDLDVLEVRQAEGKKKKKKT